MNDRACPRDGVRPYLESLEARLLLSGTAAQQALELFSVSPALFVENQGQWADPSVRYVHHGNGVNVAMTDAGPVFQVLRDDPVNLQGPSDPPADRIDPEAHNTQVLQFSASFVGAAVVVPVGVNRSDALFNYFLGDQSSWRSNVPGYEQVAYQGLYPGVDLLAQGLRSHLKYEFHVAPGADWSQITVRYEGIAGLALAEGGALRVSLGGLWGEVLDDAPYAYQVIGDQRVAVAASFALLDGTSYGFSITGAYDPTRELVIDPDLAWASYWGQEGSGDDQGNGIAVDGSGSAYVTGRTSSAGLATPGAYQTTYGSSYDAFVAKFNSTGTGLAYCTYLGGNGDDCALGIAVDGSGCAYVTGYTYSAALATVGAYQTTFGGWIDAFVGKLNSAGSALAYCTYLGGGGSDRGCGIAVDSSGSAYVTGYTSSAGLATPGAYQTTYGGGTYGGDAFAAKFNSTGSGLTYCTYLGGSGNDYGYGIAVDGSGSAYVTGYTTSTDLATAGAYQTTYGGGNSDAFVAKLNSTGSGLPYCTYLGSGGTEESYGIAVDGSGSACVTGRTSSSTGLATAGAYQTTYGGGAYDAFVAKFSSDGTALAYCTYLGGVGMDHGYGIAVDGSGSAYVTGETRSSGLATAGAYQTTYCGGLYDAFVAKFNSTGSGLAYCTYLGGGGAGNTGDDRGYGIAVDGSGNAYVTGCTHSTGLATAGAYQTTFGGGTYDAFVAKLSSTGSGLPYFTYLGGGGDDIGNGIAVDGSGSAYVTGYTSSTGLATAGAYQTTWGSGSCDAFVAKLNSTGSGLVYCTYLGGGGDDHGFGIAVDGSGSAYVTGYTSSTGLATVGAYQTTCGGSYDAFVAKFNSTGSGLAYFTYLGGSADDYGFGIAVDGSGSAYVTGYTSSTGLATVGAYQTTCGGFRDAFVAKLNSTGSGLAYCTYLGGAGYDYGYGIAVDGSGSAYVTGETSSTGLATAGAYQTTPGGGGSNDAFVAKFNSTGSGLAYCTYLGGVGGDNGYGIAVDSSGNAHVTGYTSSTGLATAGAYQTTYGGGNSDAFVAKFNSTGSAMVYCTYLGGNGYDLGRGIAVDGSGSAYVTGETTSTGLATAGAYQTTRGGTYDAFVAKFNSTGSGLAYCTYLGGGGNDEGRGIAVDGSGNAYVTGYTSSTGLATPGAYDTILTFGMDAFVAKLLLERTPPVVTKVLVSGTSWVSSFLDFLQSSGLGTGGYAIPVGSGVQLKPLPWMNIDQVKVVFSGEVVIDSSDLLLSGVNTATYAVGSFNYAPATFTATWTLSAAIGADKLLIGLNADGPDPIRDIAGNALDGEWTNPTSPSTPSSSVFPSGNGTTGGNFEFRFNVLPGDVNQNGVVQANDGLTVRAALGTSTVSGGLYSVFKDINANGVIQSNDGLSVRSRLGWSLPSGEPTGGMGGMSAPLSEAGGVPAPLSEAGEPAQPMPNPSAVTSPTVWPLSGPAASPSIPIPMSSLSGSGAFDVLAAAAPVGGRPRRASSVSASASNAGAASGILVDTSMPIGDSLYDLEGNRRGAGLIPSLIC